MAKAKDELVLHPTSLPHVFQADVDDSGFLKEILLVKKWGNGTIAYIEVNPLHQVDKARIKRIITGQHSDKYECWELLVQSRLSNGMNALEFFHTNNVKMKYPRGVSLPGQGLESIKAYGADEMVGTQIGTTSTVNPAEVQPERGFRG